MFHYSFNDCFKRNYANNDVKECLQNSLKHYRIISDEFPNDVKGILTDRSPHQIKINDHYVLSDIIFSLGREEKNYALRLFTKYPIENFYPALDVNHVLVNDYTIKVSDIHYDAFCAKINSTHDGFLFSLALHNDIKKDQLCIFENKTTEKYIDNLFGEESNTEYNIRTLKNKIDQSKVGFDKFITVFNNPIYYKNFKDEFNGLTVETQNAIMKKFARAKSRNLPTPFSADNDIIKDVTPDKEKTVKLCELRIFEPVPVRLYFFEDTTERIFLAAVRKKPAKKVQSTDIKTSISLIKSLLKINA